MLAPAATAMSRFFGFTAASAKPSARAAPGFMVSIAAIHFWGSSAVSPAFGRDRHWLHREQQERSSDEQLNDAEDRLRGTLFAVGDDPCEQRERDHRDRDAEQPAREKAQAERPGAGRH